MEREVGRASGQFGSAVDAELPAALTHVLVSRAAILLRELVIADFSATVAAVPAASGVLRARRRDFSLIRKIAVIDISHKTSSDFGCIVTE